MTAHVVYGWRKYQDVPCGSVRFGLAEVRYILVSLRAGVIQRHVVLTLILTAQKKVLLTKATLSETQKSFRNQK